MGNANRRSPENGWPDPALETIFSKNLPYSPEDDNIFGVKSIASGDASESSSESSSPSPTSSKSKTGSHPSSGSDTSGDSNTSSESNTSSDPDAPSNSNASAESNTPAETNNSADSHTSAATDTSDQKQSSHTGVIVGGAIGGLAGVLGLLVLLYAILRCRKRSNSGASTIFSRKSESKKLFADHSSRSSSARSQSIGMPSVGTNDGVLNAFEIPRDGVRPPQELWTPLSAACGAARGNSSASRSLASGMSLAQTDSLEISQSGTPIRSSDGTVQSFRVQNPQATEKNIVVEDTRKYRGVFSLLGATRTRLYEMG